MPRFPNDYREAYPAPGAATSMKQLTRIALPASSSAPMTRIDAEFIVDVFAGVLDSHQDSPDEIQVRM